MQVLDLGGAWTLQQKGKTQPIPATVPGCVHTDLLASGLIPDPYYRDNERSLQWIGETDWAYTRTFTVDEALLEHDRVILRCEGLDTLATVMVNRRKVAETDNMFRTWEFDVRDHLKPGENTISVGFKSTIPYIKKRQKERYLHAWKGPLEVQGGNRVRKEGCNYGWDWGPVLVTCGIWRNISLIAFNTAHISDVHIRQHHRNDGSVRLDISIECDTVRRRLLNAEVAVRDGDKEAARGKSGLRNGRGKVTLTIEHPLLWWPNGLGEQHLYEVNIRLEDNEGELDSVVKKIGLRKLGVRRIKDRWGESFGFAVNGVPFFAKGANWIPADTFATRLTEAGYRDLLQSAADANMNMLRVWGGGIYEPDVFYDICDELGICVWQDFMFACSAYPAFDEDFMSNVREEVTDNVKRLRHHACLTLWCGNNELEPALLADEWDNEHMGWEDYKKLFDVLIPDTVKLHDPDTDYWPCSPHVPHEREHFADDRWGDAHLWQVWHGKLPFEWYRTSKHRFVSEFGFQSFPEPKTVEGYTLPEDRNITSYVMEHHQRSPVGNTTIMTYMLEWFRLPSDFNNTLWLSQILQGIGMKYAVEHWRRNMPRTMGALYWQLNDCWPVASWASIDYHHRWKALQYLAKRFYAPLLVSAVEDAGTGIIEVWVTSDLTESKTGTLIYTVTRVDGDIVREGSLEIDIPPLKSRRAIVLALRKEVEKYGQRDLIAWLELVVDGKVISSDTVLFSRPKHLELCNPGIEIRVTNQGKEVIATIKAKRPALWARLELEGAEARFSDNFFHLSPGREVKVAVCPSEKIDLTEIRERLKVRSLRDTYLV